MVLPFEQYAALRKQGLTPAQIKQLEKDKAEGKKLGGLVGGAARFLGIEDFGRGIGHAIAGTQGLENEANETAALQDRVLQQIRANRAAGKDTSRLEAALKESQGFDIGQEIQDVGTGGLSNKQVLGSAALTGLNIATAGGTGQAVRGSLGAAAGTRVANAIPAGNTLLSKVGIGAATGAAFGAANALHDDKNVITAAVTGAGVGGALTGILSAAARGIRSATTKSPESLMQKVVRQGSADLAAESAGRKPNLARQMIDRGYKGSDESIIERASKELAESERQLQSLRDRNPNTFIDSTRLIRSLDEIVRRKRNILGQASPDMQIVRTFKDAIKAKGPRLTLDEAYQLKRDLYNELSESAFNSDVLGPRREVIRTLASAVRKEIAGTSQVAARIDAEQQFLIRVLDNVEAQLKHKGKLNALGLSDTIFASAGVAGGDVASALTAGLIKRGVESTQFRTRAAIRLSQLGELIDKLPTDTGGNINKAALMDLIGKAAGSVSE
jgi:hypothetical protein